MAVAPDATATTSGEVISTLTITAFTISGSNRAGLLGLSHLNNTATSITGSIGGTSGTAITGTDSTTTKTWRSLMFGVTAPPTGSQTATMSWTGDTDAVLGVITATGVDQTTPFNNGTFASGASAQTSVTITSATDDMTADTISIDGNPTTSNQTSQWATQTPNGLGGAGSRAAGAATVTHTRDATLGPTNWTASGANYKQAAAAAADGFDGRVLRSRMREW